MKKISLSIIIILVIFIPFISTPLGEKVYHSYQSTPVYTAIYCQYVEWFGTSGIGKIKALVRCKLSGS